MRFSNYSKKCLETLGKLIWDEKCYRHVLTSQVSLSALKECIQARTLASAPGSAHNTHVPYRRSKLTLLLKDIFEVSCPRLTSTVVLATLNPGSVDVHQTKTTLEYVAPLREAVGMFGRTKKAVGGGASNANNDPVVLEVDANDPALWNEEQMQAWLKGEGVADASFAGLSGLQVCAMPEAELYIGTGTGR